MGDYPSSPPGEHHALACRRRRSGLGALGVGALRRRAHVRVAGEVVHEPLGGTGTLRDTGSVGGHGRVASMVVGCH